MTGGEHKQTTSRLPASTVTDYQSSYGLALNKEMHFREVPKEYNGWPMDLTAAKLHGAGYREFIKIPETASLHCREGLCIIHT